MVNNSIKEMKTISDSLVFQAKNHPDKTALIYRKEQVSYRSFYSVSAGVAKALREKGIKKYDRCALYMEKRLEEAQAVYAINLADGIFVDINHLLKGDQIRHILMDSGARVLFSTAARVRGITEILNSIDSLDLVVVTDDPGPVEGLQKQTAFWEECRPETGESLVSSMVETDPAAIIYTSGSTGKSKGVVVSQRNLVAGAQSVTQYLENTPDDRILSVLPFSFDYGLNQLTSAVHVGCTCVLINYLLINDITKAAKEHQVTGMGLIPPLWLQLLQKKWDKSSFPHLRYITNTGGAMPETAVRELRNRLPQTRIFLMFGLTEAFRGTFLSPDLVDVKPTSIGKAIPNAEIWILNDRLEHCRPYEEGVLVQRGAHVSLGYWNDPEKTALYFKENPLIPSPLQQKDTVVFSGDTVYCDEDGDIYFKYRADDMIKSSGYRISPTDIEETLYRHPDIKHATALGKADPILGQAVCCVVSLKKGAKVTDRELTGFCSKELPNYMVPKSIHIIDELPLNQNGKLDRNQIKNEYANEK